MIMQRNYFIYYVYTSDVLSYVNLIRSSFVTYRTVQIYMYWMWYRKSDQIWRHISQTEHTHVYTLYIGAYMYTWSPNSAIQCHYLQASSGYNDTCTYIWVNDSQIHICICIYVYALVPSKAKCKMTRNYHALSTKAHKAQKKLKIYWVQRRQTNPHDMCIYKNIITDEFIIFFFFFT